MAAHGMDVALVFGWTPYADSGGEIFKTGSRSWEKRETPPMWFMIDVDGTRLPGYHAAKRSAAEIAALHKRIDMRGWRLLKSARSDTDVGLSLTLNGASAPIDVTLRATGGPSIFILH